MHKRDRLAVRVAVRLLLCATERKKPKRANEIAVKLRHNDDQIHSTVVERALHDLVEKGLATTCELPPIPGGHTLGFTYNERSDPSPVELVVFLNNCSTGMLVAVAKHVPMYRRGIMEELERRKEILEVDLIRLNQMAEGYEAREHHA